MTHEYCDPGKPCLVSTCNDMIKPHILTVPHIEASAILTKAAQSNPEFENFMLHTCVKFDDDVILSLAKNDIVLTRQSRTLYSEIQRQFGGCKVWLVETDSTDNEFIADLFFPVAVHRFGTIYGHDGSNVEKTSVQIRGKWTRKFPIDLEQVVLIARAIRNVEIVIEFEDD